MKQEILRYTNEERAAKAEIEGFGGKILHQLSPTAFIAEVPDALELSKLKASSAEPLAEPDASTRLAVEAWKARTAPKPESAEAGRQAATEGLAWDTPGYQSPHKPRATSSALSTTGDILESNNTPTSLYLTGSVAVGVVLVSRDRGAEAFSDQERSQIIQEVQTGLDWLAKAEPRARLSWVYDIRLPSRRRPDRMRVKATHTSGLSAAGATQRSRRSAILQAARDMASMPPICGRAGERIGLMWLSLQSISSITLPMPCWKK
jgi:hypothetical protein